MDWLREAVESYKSKVELGLEIFVDFNSAIEYANENSTVGKKAKDIAISEIKGR